MPSLSKAFVVFANQFGCVIEIFYIEPSVAFWAVASLANEIWNVSLLIIRLLSKWLISKDLQLSVST